MWRLQSEVAWTGNALQSCRTACMKNACSISAFGIGDLLSFFCTDNCQNTNENMVFCFWDYWIHTWNSYSYSGCLIAGSPTKKFIRMVSESLIFPGPFPFYLNNCIAESTSHKVFNNVTYSSLSAALQPSNVGGHRHFCSNPSGGSVACTCQSHFKP